MKKAKQLIVITTIDLKYTEPLNAESYQEEIEGVMEKVKKGAREWAYSVQLKEKKTEVFIK